MYKNITLNSLLPTIEHYTTVKGLDCRLSKMYGFVENARQVRGKYKNNCQFSYHRKNTIECTIAKPVCEYNEKSDCHAMVNQNKP